MHISAGNPAVGRSGAVGPSVRKAVERPCHVAPLGPSHVNLVAREPDAVRHGLSGDLAHRLRIGQHGVDLQQSQTVDGSGRALQTVRVRNRPSHHLESAAQAENAPAAAAVRENVDVPPFLPQRGEIRDGRLAAGKDDEIRIRRQRGAALDHRELHRGFGVQRVEIVEIRDPREVGDGDPDMPAAPAFGGVFGRFFREIVGVLGGQKPRAVEERHQPQRRPTGPRGDIRHASVEQGRIAPHLVDDEADDQRGIGGVDHRFRADQRGDHAAPVDVPDQHDGNIGSGGEAHVRDVRIPQVRLRRAAGALDDDEIRRFAHLAEAFQHSRQQPPLGVLELARAGDTLDPALNDDLRAGIGARFQQNGVHVHAGRDPRRARLKGLRPADFAAIGRDGGVVRHVLRLERADGVSAVGERSQESGGEDRLADVRARPLQHDRPSGHQYSMPSWVFTPALKWCLTRVISVTRSAASNRGALAFRPVTTTCRSFGLASSPARTSSSDR